MMKKAKRLNKRGFKCIDDAIKLLKKVEATVFFEVDDDDDDHDYIYDFPYAYQVTKHGFYIQGNVCGLDGEGNAEVFMTGEDWGELRTIPINEVPVESIFALLELI